MALLVTSFPGKPEGDSYRGRTYELTIHDDGSIRIERNGRGQNIRHENLSNYGWNVLAHSAILIEKQISGEVG
jgi:hypothetical protein